MTEKKMAALLFLGVFAAEFAVGFYYSYVLGYMHLDAMSRVANAYYVLFSRDPHLAAIGFVWPPLPSMVELAFLVFSPLIPALASAGVAGVLMSSLFAAATSSYLFYAGCRFGLGKGPSLAFSLLYAFNPLIFYFGFTGLSDAPFNFFLIYMIIQFLFWLDNDEPGHLIKAGFSMAMAFWTRYEAVPLGVAVAAGSVVAILFMRSYSQLQGGIRYRFRVIEGTWCILLAPAVYSGLMWIGFNYIIMDNSLYFLNSEYSNLAQASPLSEDQRFAELFASPLKSLSLVVQKTSYFSIPFLLVCLIRLMEKRLFRWDMLILILLFASIPALQWLMLLKGASFAWFRYFMYVLPLTVAWIPYEISKTKYKKTMVSIAMAAMVMSAGVLGYAISDPEIAPDEHTTLTLGLYYETQKQEKQIAKDLDKHYPDKTIMMDSASAYTIIVNTKYPKRFLITSDRTFRKSMSEPWRHGVDYILLPKPSPGAPRSTINSVYPNLFQHGADWAQLVQEYANGNWRLYKIIEPESSRNRGGNT